MKVLIASDHAGYELKNELISYLQSLGHEVTDFGAKTFDSNDDYPDFIAPLAKEISANPDELRGIIIGGSGQGEAIVANRFSGVRAVVYYGESKSDLDMIEFTREHNNANVLSLGARFLSVEDAKSAVKKWLETPFSRDERHIRRLKKIDDLTTR